MSFSCPQIDVAGSLHFVPLGWIVQLADLPGPDRLAVTQSHCLVSQPDVGRIPFRTEVGLSHSLVIAGEPVVIPSLKERAAVVEVIDSGGAVPQERTGHTVPL